MDVRDAAGRAGPGRVWSRHEAARRTWRDASITHLAFDPGFRVVLAAMRSCRLFGLAAKVRDAQAGAPEEWLARCSARDGAQLVVDLSAAGYRDDLEAWW